MGFCIRKFRLLRLKLKKHWMTIVWVALCIGMFYMDYMRYKRLPQYYYLRRMLGIGMCISRGTAAVLNLSCCVLVVPMCRALATNVSAAVRSFLSQFQPGPPNTRPPTLPALLSSRATQTAKSVHTMIAVTVMVASVLHTGAHIGNAVNSSRYYSSQYPEINVAAHRGGSPFYLFVGTVPGITGIAMVMVLSVLALTSTKWARRSNYNTFFYTHHLGLLFLVLLLVHPLSGVLKEQKNLHGHIPGCQMYGSPVIEEGFPEPEPGDYYEIPANNASLREFQEAYHQSKSYPEESNLLDSSKGDSKPSSFEADIIEGNAEDDQGREAEVKVSVWRTTCSEAPVFQSIHSQTWIWITVAFMLWTADSMVRWWRQRADVHVVNVVHHPCDIVQLTLHQSGFSCTPGQYVLVQCPSVSRFEWHPFTVTCPPVKQSSDTFTILMRVRGDWSSRVASLFPDSSKSSHPLQCDSPSNDANSIYSTITKQSSLRTKNLDNYTSQALCTPVEHDRNTHRVSEHKTPFIPSSHSASSSCCMKAIEKSKSYSFSPEISNKNLRFQNRSVFCAAGRCFHSDFLYSNILLLNTNSLPNDSRSVNSCSDHLQENKFNSQLLLHKSKCDTYSGTTSPKPFGKRTYCHKNYLQHLQRNKNVIQNDLLYPETRIHSHIHNGSQSNCSAKHFREEMEDHTININSPCYARLRVDGPYSSPSEEMLHYPVIIGAAGGVGITPLAATLSHKLWHPMMWPRRIHMVWVVRDARLLLVIAPLLSSLLLHCWQTNMEDCIELRLHVTIPTTQQVLQDLFARDYPSLLPRITQGRPHWKHLFQEWRQIYTRKKVGVFTCGPPKMCRQVKRHCLQAVTKGAHFNYHQESFS